MKKLLPLSLLFFTLLFSNCKKDPEIIVETVTVTDTLTVTVTDTVTVIQNDTVVVIDLDTVFNTIEDDSTIVFILVRHAEVVAGGSNPVLSADGQVRAAELRRILKNVELDAIYSTNFSRTIGTANPTAIDQGISIDIYEGSDMSEFKDEILANNKGQTILVSGHSDTTPNLLNALTNTNDFEFFPEDSYDRLFFVTVSGLGKATVFQMEYGVDTP